MPANVVETYGWTDERETVSAGYITSAILNELRALKARRVLDLGAGNGALCGRLKKEGFDVVGVEFDQHGVEVAKRAHQDIRFYRFGVEDDASLLMESELPFDAIVSTEVIEHLFSPHLLPLYAKRALKSHGHLIVTTPYHGYLKNLILAILDRWDFHHTALWHGGHIKFWSRRTLSQLLADNGFRVERFGGAGRLPYLWKSMIVTASVTAA